MIDHNYQQEDTFIDNAVLYTVGCEGASGTVDRTMPWQRPNWDLHINRPSVYLDRWVWIRLARAANGAPQHTSDVPTVRHALP